MSLDSTTLEQSPEVFLEILKEQRETYANTGNPMNDPMNSPHHKRFENYFSNLLICLIYLVGDLVQRTNVPPGTEYLQFYGMDTTISDNMGVEILDLMMERCPDIFDTNYYGETALSIVSNYSSTTGATYRINNRRFLDRFMEHAGRYSINTNEDQN